jgi:predicted Rossmann fold flavoprotein
MSEQADIAIVGAGAAGLAAGIFASEAFAEPGRGTGTFSKPKVAIPALRIVLLDGAKTIGAKILVSGGGRCNVTHEEVRPGDFHGSQPVVRNILAAFPTQATREWFASLGVELKREETGKLFPVTDKAHTVLHALTNRCRELGIAILPRHRVSDVIAVDGFLVQHEQGELHAGRVIMATGGRSLPRTGSDGHGWEIVRRLGHTVTSCHPALVPLVLGETIFHAELSGLSQETELTTLVDGKRVDRRIGSMLWTHFGVSGPVAMDASRFWTIAHAEGATVEVRCNFLPGVDFDEAERRLIAQMEARPKLSVGKTLGYQIPERLATALCRYCEIDPGTPAGQLAREARRKLVHALTGLPLPILRDRGWNYAEVTAGGVPLDEINFRTMESRKVHGLHLIGEMLDCDGRIGGFNFQWAWASGYLGGRGAVAGLRGTG